MKFLTSSREDILNIYLNDERPWVIGYSGGKDSTAVVRLVYEALLSRFAVSRTFAVDLLTRP